MVFVGEEDDGLVLCLEVFVVGLYVIDEVGVGECECVVVVIYG